MEKRKVFIQANDSQIIGGHVATYSIKRFFEPGDDIEIEIMHVEKIPQFQNFIGSTYLQGSEERTYSFDDAQSFTLTRFMPPELMGYEGKAIVIDPDVFAVQDIRELFDFDMKGNAVAACEREGKGFWDTSVMLLDCAKLKHWNTEKMLSDLGSKKMNYNTVMRQIFNEQVTKLPRKWNDLDLITEETKMIHMTRQRTQPWKTGLPFNVTPRNMGKVMGIIPVKWTARGRDKYPKLYPPHPDKKILKWFFTLIKEGIEAGAITKEFIEGEIEKKHIRKDMFEVVSSV